MARAPGPASASSRTARPTRSACCRRAGCSTCGTSASSTSQPTADLCQAYGAALTGAAGKVAKTQSNYLGVAIDLEGQLPNIKWLIANRCDLGQPLGLLAGNVRAVADSCA